MTTSQDRNAQPEHATVSSGGSVRAGLHGLSVVGPWAWTGYLVLAPIVWLPSVPAQFLSTTRIVLFLLVVATTWISSRDRSLPRGLPGPVGLGLILVGSAFAMFLSQDDVELLRGVAEPIVAFAVMWTAYVYQRNGGDLWSAIARAALVISVAAALVVLAWAGWDLIGPSPSGLGVASVGFATSRATWGSALSAFAPLALAAALTVNARRGRYVLTGAVLAMPASFLVAGNRSALVSSLVGIAIVLWFAVGWRTFWASVAILGLAIWRMPESIASHLRFDRFTSSTLESLNALSTHRLEGYGKGFEAFLERPIIGSGFGRARVTVDSVTTRDFEIHNVWLKLGVEGGVILLLAVASVVAVIFARSGRLLASVAQSGRPTHQPIRAAGLLGALVAGLLASMFEPNALLGNMHSAATWWMCAGMAVAGESSLRRLSDMPDSGGSRI